MYSKLERVQRFRFSWPPLMTAVTLFMTLVVGVRPSLAQGAAQPTYASAGQATQALYEAVQNNNEQAILQILGGRKELASSGDGLEDKVERELFAGKYQEMHRLVRQADGSIVLYIGAENWPFPVPVISEKGKWRFGAEAGTQEIFFRRIGENEAAAIEVCHVLVRAITGDTSETGSNDPLVRYAQTLVSAQAADAGPTLAKAQGTSAPFDGYYFRQVSSAPGITGGGVAFVAFPAEYRVSGVMTLVVTADNVVFQKDLGPNTARLVKTIDKDTPYLSWQLAE